MDEILRDTYKYIAPTSPSRGRPAAYILDKSYIEGGTWKCKGSPTGAHRWQAGHSSKFICMYCKEERNYDRKDNRTDSTDGVQGVRVDRTSNRNIPSRRKAKVSKV